MVVLSFGKTGKRMETTHRGSLHSYRKMTLLPPYEVLRYRLWNKWIMHYIEFIMNSLSTIHRYIVSIYIIYIWVLSFKPPRLRPKKAVTTKLEFQGFLVPFGRQICSISTREVEDQGAGDAGDAIFQELRLPGAKQRDKWDDRDVWRISNLDWKNAWNNTKNQIHRNMIKYVYLIYTRIVISYVSLYYAVRYLVSPVWHAPFDGTMAYGTTMSSGWYSITS